MTKIDMDKHTDREIINGLVALPAGKFLAVLNGLSAISQKMETRGKLIASEGSNEVVEKMVRQLFEDENDSQRTHKRTHRRDF